MLDTRTRRRLLLFTAISSLSVACSDDEAARRATDRGEDNVNNVVDEAPDAATSDTPDADLDADAPPDAPDPPECPYTEEEQPIPTPDLYTPRWAFEPWISKDISDGPDTYAFVEGFKSRDIPVGVVVLDSPWETNYNTFIPNPERYPEFEKLISDMREQDVRVVLWVTQLVNRNSFDAEEGGDLYDGPSPNYQEGLDCDFFVEDGQVYFWWKGNGAAVDFFNPRAVAWWHRQQDALLDLGIAGWKLDFGDSYIDDDPMDTFAGSKSLQEYSEEYYRDFWAYGASKLGTREFITMVRPYDDSYQFEGRFFARPEHAPVSWVGDNRRDFVGFIDALDHIFRSAKAGYVVVGSDLGGYLDRNDENLTELIPFNQPALDQWTAVAALTPFMQLHGRANLEPWNAGDDPESYVAIYRHWAKLHHEMVDFWYSITQEAYANDDVIIHPVGDNVEDWTDDWRFVVGEAFLVAPTLDETGVRDVELPAGARWYDWWDPAGDALEGGQTLTAYEGAADRLRTPFFIREGAIIPMRIADDASNIGDASLADLQTILVYPGEQASRFVLHDTDDLTTTIDATTTNGGVDITLTRALRPVALRVRTDVAPTDVALNGASLQRHDDRQSFDDASSGFHHDAALNFLWIKNSAASPDAPINFTIR